MSGAPSGGFSQGGAIMPMAGAGGVVAGGAGGTRPSEAGAAGDDGAGGEPPEPSVVEMSVGAFHSCARFDDGSLRCFGSTLHSGLGLGSNFALLGDDEPASSAADVVIGGRVAQISASWYQTCALLASGKIRCWGNAGDGRLGYANNETIGDDESPIAAGDVQLGGLVLSVATGPDHSCAVLEGGNVRCFGKNDDYQLGYSSPVSIGDDELPESAPFVDVGGKVKQLALGLTHSCALLETGSVRCWGTGNGGQLGYGHDGIIGDDETPASAGDIDLGGAATQITAGLAHTCALLDTGKVRCWGRGYDGLLGYGNVDHIGDDETPASAGDVDVGGTVKQVSAGDYATCALLTDGTVRCWGSSQMGELGQGNDEIIGDDETPASVPPVDVGGVVTQLDVGFLHVCATLETGKARCWGRATTGALGYGNVENIGDDETPASAGDVPVR